jgi:5'(3')-deoxyribonucleotidase
MNNEYKIYIDMDGVVADFDTKAIEITKGKYKSEDFSNSQFWKTVYAYNSDVGPFFESVPKMKDADELVNYITKNFKNVKFLTATGTTPKDAPEQKRNWINKYFPGIDVITVVNSSHKAIYANPRSILIDDREKAIDPWRKAGGIGILFKNNSQTISELKQFLK